MQKRRSKNLKDDILHVAELGFKTEGYDATTFQKIANELGITKGAITYHYKNKHLIVSQLIQEMFDSLRQFICGFPEGRQNLYRQNCIMYIYAYRLIMKSLRNQELFYHRDQMYQWQTGKVQTVYNIYKIITQEMGRENPHEELLMKTYMDLGARKRLYYEYLNNPYLLTLDQYCYYHVFLIGCLCQLSDAEIRLNIDEDFKFTNSHTPPAPAAV